MDMTSLYAGRKTRDQLELDIGSTLLKIYQGDITKVDVEAIVNSTNAEFDLSRGNICNESSHFSCKISNILKTSYHFKLWAFCFRMYRRCINHLDLSQCPGGLLGIESLH